MRYSIELKKEIQDRIKKGEKIKKIHEETLINVSTLYNWKKQLNLESDKQETINDNVEDEKETSKKIREMIKFKDLETAYKLTSKYPNDRVIQSQRITILINRKDYRRAKEIGARFRDYPPIQSQMVTIAIKEGKHWRRKREYEKANQCYQKAKKIIINIENNEVDKNSEINKRIQSQMIKILLEEAEFFYQKEEYEEVYECYEKAKKIVTNIENNENDGVNEIAQSQMMTILLEEAKFWYRKEEYKKAKECYENTKKIGNNFINDSKIQSKMVKILIEEAEFWYQKEEYKKAKECYEKIKEIEHEFKDDEVIKSQMITILFEETKYWYKKENYEKTKECYNIVKKTGNKFKYNVAIQSQMIKVLIEEGEYWSRIGNYEKAKECYNQAKEIGNKFRSYFQINTQIRGLEYKIVKLQTMRMEIQKADNEKDNTKTDKKFMNRIRTILYYNKEDEETIREVEESRDISDYERIIILLAICEKTRKLKLAKKIFQEVKEKVQLKKEEIKTLNKIMERVKSKNKKIFDFGVYDNILYWNFDLELVEQYEKESEANKVKNNRNQFQKDFIARIRCEGVEGQLNKVEQNNYIQGEKKLVKKPKNEDLSIE